MFARCAILLALGGLLAGCANETPGYSGLGVTNALAIVSPQPSPAADADKVHKKTMSDRVLAAIAFERVTGMKSDPARLRD
ncbi:MAG: hypothetical protein JSS20_04785 [Proteobacteria bacterium]|nr:hypothetical protein [Pseudomonadota bacterium]